MNQAAIDLYNSPSTDRNIQKAQLEIVNDMFWATGYYSAMRQTVKDRFASIAAWNVNRGVGEKTLIGFKSDGSDGPDKAVYRTLRSDKLLIFCNYARFQRKAKDDVYDRLIGYVDFREA